MEPPLPARRRLRTTALACLLTTALACLLPAAAPTLAAPAVAAPAVAPGGAATPLVVTADDDLPDADVADLRCATSRGTCSLRAALQTAAARPGGDLVGFAAPPQADGVVRIELSSALPELSDDGTTVDGLTQPGARAGDAVRGVPADLRVEVRGQGDAFPALVLTGAGAVVRGLAVHDVLTAVHATGRSRDAVVVGNHLGTDAAGTASRLPGSGTGVGVRVTGGATGTRVGGPAPGDGNVVSGSPGTGVHVEGAGTAGTVVQGNLVGLTPDGLRALPNRFGVDVNRGATGTLVGGALRREGNVVSGNARQGVEVSHDPSTRGTSVVGNLIGTDVSGERAPDGLGNGDHGVLLEDRVADTVLRDNVVVGAAVAQVQVTGAVTGTRLERNGLGVSRTGRVLGGGLKGLLVTGGAGPVLLEGGRVSGMREEGVVVGLEGESLGLRIRGTRVWGNGGLGINLPRLLVPGAVPPWPDAPVITSARGDRVAGTACPGCEVELFVSDDDRSGYGEGRQLLGTARADAAGAWEVRGHLPGARVSATGTPTDGRAAGTTSEFSRAVDVRDPLVPRRARRSG